MKSQIRSAGRIVTALLVGAVWIGAMASYATAAAPIAVGGAEKSRPAVDLSTAIIQVAEKAIPADRKSVV